MSESFPPVDAAPYPWPYDGKWSLVDTVVLAIDFQRDLCAADGFLHANGIGVSEAAKVLKRAADILGWARKRSINIIYTRQVYEKQLRTLSPTRAVWSTRTQLPIGKMGPLGLFMIDGEPGSEIVKSLAPQGEEPLVDRPSLNPFLHSDLHNILLKMGIRNIIVIGALLESAVHTAVCAANDRGYEVLLVADACLSSSPSNSEVVKRTTALGGGLFGTVGTCEALFGIH